MINKKSLEIKNKKLLIKEEDDYLDSVKSMTSGIVGDVAKFTKDSSKIIGNLSKLLAKSGWYTFRAKILGNMTDEEFKRSLKDTRVDFVTNSDANIRNIDSNILKMLSSVGVSEDEVNGYLLGFPGYNVLEKINVSSFLTGRKYKKDKFNKLNPFEFTAEEIILFFMINNLNNASGGSIRQPNNSQVKKVLTDNASKKQIIITQLTKTLNNKISNNFLEIINKEVIKKKNKDYFNLVKKSLKGTTFLSYKISKAKDATVFFAHVKSTFNIVVKKDTKKQVTSDTDTDSSSQEPTSEMFDKLSLRINNNNLTLITEKDEFELDEYRKIICELLDTIAVSTVLIDKNISKIILGEQLKEIQEGLEDAKEEVQETLTVEDKEEIQTKSDKNNEDNLKTLSYLYFLISNILYRFEFYQSEIWEVSSLLSNKDTKKIKDRIKNFETEFKDFFENRLGKENDIIIEVVNKFINKYTSIMKKGLEDSINYTDDESIDEFIRYMYKKDQISQVENLKYSQMTVPEKKDVRRYTSLYDDINNTQTYLNLIEGDIACMKDEIYNILEKYSGDHDILSYCEKILLDDDNDDNDDNNDNDGIRKLAESLKNKYAVFRDTVNDIKNHDMAEVYKLQASSSHELYGEFGKILFNIKP
jgi:hypothetical protein